MTKPKLVYVEWNDAHSRDRWDTIDNVLVTMTDLMHCKTVGYLLSKDVNCIVVANTIAWEGDPVPTTCGVLHIPRGCVTYMKEIKLY